VAWHVWAGIVLFDLFKKKANSNNNSSLARNVTAPYIHDIYEAYDVTFCLSGRYEVLYDAG